MFISPSTIAYLMAANRFNARCLSYSLPGYLLVIKCIQLI